MMIVDAWDSVSGNPVRVNVTQLVVYNNQGTPIMVAAEYGMDGAQCIAKAGDLEFERVLRAVGFGHHKVVVEDLKLSPPPRGATLLNPS